MQRYGNVIYSDSGNEIGRDGASTSRLRNVGNQPNLVSNFTLALQTIKLTNCRLLAVSCLTKW